MHDHHLTGHHHHADAVSGTEGLNRLIKALEYMHMHNIEHRKELENIGEKLRASGKAEIADAINKAAASYENGNSILAEALNSLKGGS